MTIETVLFVLDCEVYFAYESTLKNADPPYQSCENTSKIYYYLTNMLVINLFFHLILVIYMFI